MLKLRNFGKTHINVENLCYDKAHVKWFPTISQKGKGGLLAACCYIYDGWKCVEKEAQSGICQGQELADLTKEKNSRFIGFSLTICPEVTPSMC